jgi:hypothetical protein
LPVPSNDSAVLCEAASVLVHHLYRAGHAYAKAGVMLMDLRNTPALLFKNTGTGRHNMVYRREDGTIGWVEPKSAP